MTLVRIHAPVSNGTTLLIERDLDTLQWIVGAWAVELYDGKLTVRAEGRHDERRPRRAQGGCVKRSRFIVSQVAGFEIRPQGMGFRGRTQAPTPYSFYVLDRAYCHRVVASFDAHGHSAVRGDSQRRKRLAEERCAELNREYE